MASRHEVLVRLVCNRVQGRQQPCCAVESGIWLQRRS